ncbi:hypothetical protein D822_01599 [Streptococcus ratti FA-1 = DSM 20564]|uniref:Secreted protein n=1 Tax=Streptococcus ratti FA-1 = DSM 20564 TaxID=699248 RepID=A0ABN0GVQ1_STRRT|nr:hypothetical protein SRA_08506 [Streptococcus ratti FA-1 = DSM 20564]EMP71314.1 hypothetical protein D822_01599 [Streptococcus ratti FA-1 = DSM 20564]QEY06496.1 hypothetical protein FY406_01780 [Streptococcus ratti]
MRIVLVGGQLTSLLINSAETGALFLLFTLKSAAGFSLKKGADLLNRKQKKLMLQPSSIQCAKIDPAAVTAAGLGAIS